MSPLAIPTAPFQAYRATVIDPVLALETQGSAASGAKLRPEALAKLHQSSDSPLDPVELSGPALLLSQLQTLQSQRPQELAKLLINISKDLERQSQSGDPQGPILLLLSAQFRNAATLGDLSPLLTKAGQSLSSLFNSSETSPALPLLQASVNAEIARHPQR